MRLRLLSAVFVCICCHSARASDPPPLALPNIRLEPVLTSGLVTPVLVTNAHDRSHRIFVVEQTGCIQVLTPGGSGPGVFLDITPRVLANGEQGLLGLAFHPQYQDNGRFFVDYTRRPDGATVIAEYHVTAKGANIADPTESILLLIPQPFPNHNGGMIEFGPDGFLYIGMGDGGSANDPGNRAQNPFELLGKILRIDVDTKEPGKAYASPAGNPFVGTGNGRSEIYALGLRNPWRFSFDPASGRLYVGDVGQNLVEEVDIVTAGGNYGWRVLEGTRCTGLGPASCSAAEFIPPFLQYGHDSARCSITGGYVYRGLRASLPYGSYTYGDFCSGEIFLLNGGTSSLVLRSGLQISSFGQDEEGEIYVVDLGGTVSRIVNSDAPSQPVFYFPRLVSTIGGIGSGAENTGLAVANLGSSAANLSFTAFGSDGQLIHGPDITNPSLMVLPPGNQFARVDFEIFGRGILSANRTAWIKLESSTREMAAFFLAFDPKLNTLDGAKAVPAAMGDIVFPDIEPEGKTEIQLANPNLGTANVTLRLVAADGQEHGRATRAIAGNGVLAVSAGALFENVVLRASDYLQAVSDLGIVSCSFLQKTGMDFRALNGQDVTTGNRTVYVPQFVNDARYRTALSVVNLDPRSGILEFRFFRDDGTQIGDAKQLPIAAQGKVFIDDPGFFADRAGKAAQGYLQITSDGVRVSGGAVFSAAGGDSFAASLPLISTLTTEAVFSQVASNATYFTGIAIVNPSSTESRVLIEVFTKTGLTLDSTILPIPAGGRSAALLTEYFPALRDQDIGSGYIRISSSRAVAPYVLFGTNNLTVLSAISEK